MSASRSTCDTHSKNNNSWKFLEEEMNTFRCVMALLLITAALLFSSCKDEPEVPSVNGRWTGTATNSGNGAFWLLFVQLIAKR
jgi:hypothetical protein